MDSRADGGEMVGMVFVGTWFGSMVSGATYEAWISLCHVSSWDEFGKFSSLEI